VSERRIAVLGAGAMGAGIAALSCRAGFATVLHDIDEIPLAVGVERIRSELSKDAERGRLGAGEAEACARRLTAVTDRDLVAGSDLVVEATPERLELKQLTLEAAARIAPEAVLATNTSSLSIASIGERLPRPQVLVGLHFFNPPKAMPLVELVRGGSTDPAAAALAREVAEAMGKTVIEVADGPGFLSTAALDPITWRP
jgi:3-hydroxyacyl-CoA dehydrogenase